ncbi:MAG: hypothetical protein JNM63_15505, partial [Spirochaetia bacterium]|nr:hypothetical protein [Spirochaetia bacterium]
MKRILFSGTLAIFLAQPALFADRAEAIEKRVLSKRNLPLTNFPVERSLRARDFGMRSDDAEDDYPALQKLLGELKTRPVPTEVIFDPGTYHLNPFAGKTPEANDFHCLEISRLTNVILSGRGCSFLVHNPQAGFIRILESARIIIRDLSVDYDPLPLSQGTIASVDPESSTLAVSINAGFPALDAPHM